ncbi:hypothetical protein CASFOL_019470 [Castilleja foliolosa]|uniref:Strictosidine synthase conserved region domain-containing protein n=1 Tax=Castilleja foliolosa TaxID=1961234 RepID=A0ABD3D6F5_9LAMI
MQYNLFCDFLKNQLLQIIMTTPLVFQAKAMSIRLFSFALLFGIIFVATIVKVFDTHQPLKNEILDGRDDFVAIPMPGGAVGPESLAFDGAADGPYTGVSDGRIIRWRANESRWVDFAVTSSQRDGCVGHHDHTPMEHICGRPLGLRFNEKTGDLYIADAYLGLLVVGPNGGLASPVATEWDGVAFGFTNSLDIDQQSGVVYFTDSSTRFARRDHISIIISGDNTGRLLKFDPATNQTTLLVNNLMFPNGVALSQNGVFLLFVETTTCRLFKFWLKTAIAGKVEVIAQLPGYPDNIKRNKNGEFWVGIHSKRDKMSKWFILNSWIGDFVVRVCGIDVTRLHLRLARLIVRYGMGIRLDKDGNVVEVLGADTGRRWRFVSEVEEQNGDLWIGSVTRSFVVREKI